MRLDLGRLDLGRFSLTRFGPGRLDRRKLTRTIAVLAIALAAGHLVQTMALRQQPAPAKVAELPKPVQVVQLAASVDHIAEPAPPLAPTPAALLPPVALSVTPPLPQAATQPAVPDAPPQVVADPCPVTLDLLADPGAMIGLLLLAPCRPGERIVITHAGLAVTETTTATGSVFMALPALQTEALVQARFADGSTVTGTVNVPDLAALRRFGVQWQGDDAFQVYGQEAGGTVSASRPGLAPQGESPASDGFLSLLGDADADAPLLAEIYTYPAHASAGVVIEAAVTPSTCGREILGETLSSVGGAVTVTDLTLAMPDCDAVGDFLLLNNLAPDPTLTAAN
jgi:hypothetical protein